MSSKTPTPSNPAAAAPASRPKSLEAFALLGVQPFLHADPQAWAALQKRYLQLSRHLHPDRHPQVTDEERERLESQSAALNGAWRKLKTLDSRLEILLEAQPSEASSEKKVAPEIAFRYFELQEALGESEPRALENLQSFRDEVSSLVVKERERLQTLSQRYPLTLPKEGLAPPPKSWSLESQDLAALRQHRDALRYLERLFEDISNAHPN